jgi:hypothetical protein
MKTRKAELVVWTDGPDWPHSLMEAGNFSWHQVQYIPTTLELIDLIKSRDLDQYEVVLIKKKDIEEFNKPYIYAYEED